MSKVTIVLEDSESGVKIHISADNEFVKTITKENTLAENLAVVAVKTMEANAENWGCSTHDLSKIVCH